MEQTTSLIQHLQKASPDLTFTASNDFGWDPTSRTIFYDEASSLVIPHLLHEYGHASLGHSSYERDITLITMERDAWKKAREVATHHGIAIPAEVVENSLDTYREWMHARSICPRCTATGIETKQQTYTCIACHATWNVNQARRCALRRYTN